MLKFAWGDRAHRQHALMLTRVVLVKRGLFWDRRWQGIQKRKCTHSPCHSITTLFFGINICLELQNSPSACSHALTRASIVNRGLFWGRRWQGKPLSKPKKKMHASLCWQGKPLSKHHNIVLWYWNSFGWQNSPAACSHALTRVSLVKRGLFWDRCWQRKPLSKPNKKMHASRCWQGKPLSKHHNIVLWYWNLLGWQN